MTLRTAGEVAGQKIEGNGSGIVQFKPPKAQLSFKVSAAGQTVAIDKAGGGALSGVMSSSQDPAGQLKLLAQPAGAKAGRRGDRRRLGDPAAGRVRHLRRDRRGVPARGRAQRPLSARRRLDVSARVRRASTRRVTSL